MIHQPKPPGVKRSAFEAWAEMWILVHTDGYVGTGVWIIKGNSALRVGCWHREATI
jgi:hypothetical protein